ncbi:MAG: hypothetical protein LUC45_06215 [Paraprevotella sp.]|nr:hypothetical protein [Paraprevotella sp.]
MKKSKYVKPMTTICHMETLQMMASSDLNRYDDIADKDLDVLFYENHNSTDIWGN